MNPPLEQRTPNCDLIHEYALKLNDTYATIGKLTNQCFEWQQYLTEARETADDMTGWAQSNPDLVNKKDRAILATHESDASMYDRLMEGNFAVIENMRELEDIYLGAIDRHTAVHASYGDCEPHHPAYLMSPLQYAVACLMQRFTRKKPD